MTDTDKQKIMEFVNHLLSIPNISGEPPLIREGMIISFITQNIQQIKETLTSPRLFPDAPPEQTLKSILLVLRQLVLKDIVPRVESWLQNRIDYRIVQKLFPSREKDENIYRSGLSEYIKKMLMNSESRYNFNAVYNLFEYDILDRYVRQIFERRGSIYNEIKRVERIALEFEEYVEYTKIILLIKNTAYLRVPITTGVGKVTVNAGDLKKFSVPLSKFIVRQEQQVMSQLPFMTKQALVSAIKSNLKERMTEKEDASARLFYILSSRYQEYKPVNKVDRGAETPDKSWFGSSKKNSGYFGFNERMLHELYLIAGDNMW